MDEDIAQTGEVPPMRFPHAHRDADLHARPRGPYAFRMDGDHGERADRAATDARLALQMALGARIRAVRNARDVGQAECARRAGLGKTSMFRLEKGEQNVTIDVLARIALVLGVGLAELLEGVAIDPVLVAEFRGAR